MVLRACVVIMCVFGILPHPLNRKLKNKHLVGYSQNGSNQYSSIFRDIEETT